MKQAAIEVEPVAEVLQPLPQVVHDPAPPAAHLPAGHIRHGPPATLE
jgi:hypothetical protein